ncbi:unnamed protein product [Acanthoscelides obtectus]|uniref:Uncharacterized protein n=1 Tax=Acanthoscelides obtectus TaxID=200917 RepID=A0A9P0KYT3_ACAOB|nr:unnamed protein product [Acanthoscelides obtectus]CAK1635896.1 hypothetical protein AOBTE_LOCUS9603 [Acanthoscelides obtectus]
MVSSVLEAKLMGFRKCVILVSSQTVNITSLIVHCQLLDQVIVDPLQVTTGHPRSYPQSLLFRC